MSLVDARPLNGAPCPPLPEGPPYSCAQLDPTWHGLAFDLPPCDPRLPELHRGAAAPSPPLDNLVGAARQWQDASEWMDFHDPGAPNHLYKRAERDLYLSHWGPHLPPGSRVLDLGSGIGRFTTYLLDQGCTVEVVDPDLRSLWRAVSTAVGRPGAIDVHWSTGEAIPDIAPVDAVVAAEVLCYVEDPAAVVARAHELLVPGGVFLASVEARWGWAMSPDVSPGTLDALLDDGIVHVPGDRWIRTCTEAQFREMLGPFTILDMLPSHYVLSGPFEMAAGPPDETDMDAWIRRVVAWEAALRQNSVTAPLHRAWTAVARK